jgi:RecA-family ATPase
MRAFTNYNYEILNVIISGNAILINRGLHPGGRIMAARAQPNDLLTKPNANLSAVPQMYRWPEFNPHDRIRTLAEVEARAAELGSMQDTVNGLIPDRNLVLLMGDSGVGKSPLLYQLGVCVATGTLFLGRTVRPGRVLYMDFENGILPVAGLLKKASKFLGVSLDGDNFLAWNFNDQGGNVASKDAHETYGKYIRKVNPKLCIIDSLSGVFPELRKNQLTRPRLFNFCGTSSKLAAAPYSGYITCVSRPRS